MSESTTQRILIPTDLNPWIQNDGMPSPVPGEPHLNRKAAFIIAVYSLGIVTPRTRSAKNSPAMGCLRPLGLSSVSKTYDSEQSSEQTHRPSISNVGRLGACPS
jgi:hypothetical protein